MAILDKLKSVGGAIKHKVAETFGDGHDQALDEEGHADLVAAAPHDAAAARRALDVGEGASLADVREAYRKLARAHYPRARREGPASAAAELLDRALAAMELLEEELLPLGGPAPSGGAPGTGGAGGGAHGAGAHPASSRRKRATPRA